MYCMLVVSNVTNSGEFISQYSFFLHENCWRGQRLFRYLQGDWRTEKLTPKTASIWIMEQIKQHVRFYRYLVLRGNAKFNANEHYIAHHN